MKNTLKIYLLVVFCTICHSVIADQIQGEHGSIEITPLIHSSVQLEYRGTVILIDPWGRVGLEAAKMADIILITDDVGHHLDPDAIEKFRKPSTQVFITEKGKEKWPTGRVMENGESVSVAEVLIETVAAYDIIPGEPSHPKGEANGYAVTLGGKRLYFAGVTECVEEVKALRDIDVAFLPMNIPLGRMTPEATAECAEILSADIIYPYHYDQDYARRAYDPTYKGSALPMGRSVAESLTALESELRGSDIEVLIGDFYPPLN
jgi:L-ascorbate metabolism protein UlaG (beta-lactamase superfamily)